MNTSNWNIDAVHSGIGFSIRHMVVSKVRGRFARYSGNLVLDDDGDLTKSAVEATIDVSSIDFGLHWTQLLETGGVLVGDRVDIELEVQAVKAAAAKAA